MHEQIGIPKGGSPLVVPKEGGSREENCGLRTPNWFPPLIPIYFNFLFFMLESKKNGSHPKTSHYGEAFVAHKKMV